MQHSSLTHGALLAPAPAGLPADVVPLVIDLDGTLLRTDSLLEQAVSLVRKDPRSVFGLVLWFLRGRMYLKARLAEVAELDPETVPINEELAAYAATEAATGRHVVLATAAHQRTAAIFAARTPFISEMLASDDTTNLKGSVKARALKERSPDGFDYAGDSPADLPVWQTARRSILVAPSGATARRAKKIADIAFIIPRPKAGRAFIRCLRPHQWAKNVLVAVPAVLSGRILDTGTLLPLLLPFLALSFIASATYVFNDLWDLEDDRRHWSKRNRPLASGILPIPLAVAGAFAMLCAGLAIAWTAVAGVLKWVLVYLVVTLLHSLWLKRKVIHDALTLATLFTIRLVVGMTAVAAAPSPWLFVFAMFIFSSLAFAKRHTEIAKVIQRGGDRVNGRGYRAVDLPLVLAAGVACSVAAVLIMVLYILEDAYQQTFISNGVWLWGLPPLVFLITSRVWIVCQRGELDDDPVIFAVTDRQCMVYSAMLLVCFSLAWFGAPL